MHLIIGNKTYSSWSMRPWLLLKRFDIPFSETLVKLDRPETTYEIKKFSASGRVPCLIDGEVTVWDSLAIMEYLNEKFPQHQMWPASITKRAEARAITCEMHSGFTDLRQHLSFHAKKRFTNYDTSPARVDIERIKEIWTRALKSSGGPFLFGNYSIADAMYAPVCGRFETYGVKLTPELQAYCERILSLPEVKEWYTGAAEEDFEVAKYEKSK